MIFFSVILVYLKLPRPCYKFTSDRTTRPVVRARQLGRPREPGKLKQVGEPGELVLPMSRAGSGAHLRSGRPATTAGSGSFGIKLELA